MVCLTVQPEAAHITPGDSLAVVLTVHNTGNSDHQYCINVSGIPNDWYHLASAHLSLSSDASERVCMIVQPSTTSATVTSRHCIEIRVASEDDPLAHASAVIDLAVSAIGGLSLDVAPDEAEGSSARFRITVSNQVSWPVLVLTTAYDPENKLRFRMGSENPVAVPSGRSVETMMHVVPKTRLPFGSTHVYTIELRGCELGREGIANRNLVRLARFKYVPPQLALWSEMPPRWLNRRVQLVALLLLIPLSLLLIHATEWSAKALTTKPGFTPISRAAGTQARQSHERNLKVAIVPRPAKKHVRATTRGGAAIPTSISASLLGAEVAGMPIASTILLNPNTMHFGNQAVGTASASKIINVVNLGPQPITIIRVTVDETYPRNFNEVTTCTKRIIAVYGACQVQVRFKPVSRGAHHASIFITDNVAGGHYRIDLSGHGGAH